MTNYVLNEDKMFADITDGVAIVINSETGIYFGMNELGTSIFESLIEGANVVDVLAALKAFEGVPADIDAQLDTYIADLVAKEILIAGGDSSKTVEISAADGFEMTVSEYNDAQELLLADPIHEVKEETGWTPEKDSIGYTKEETAEREKKMEQ